VKSAADVLVLTEDPREDIRNLRAIEAVVLAGHVVERAGSRENGRDPCGSLRSHLLAGGSS